jgi:hypothetical protein
MKLSYNPENTIAILIGISQYDSDNEFPPIQAVTNNLNELKKLLFAPDFFGIPKEHIILLKNKTNVEIIKELIKALSIPLLETVIVYYAGHGYRTARDKLYLTAINSERNFDVIVHTGIEFAHLKKIIEEKGKQRIFIIDACYSGIATQGNETLTGEELNIKGTCIIASSPHNEPSFYDPEKKTDCTFFTSELIDFLKEGTEDAAGFLTINKIYENIRKRLNEKNRPEPNKKTT